MFRFLKWILFIFIIIFLFKYFLVPVNYRQARFFPAPWWFKSRYNLGKHQIPEEYRLVGYWDADYNESFTDTEMLVYEHKETKQLLVLMRFWEFPKIDSKKILLKEVKVKFFLPHGNRFSFGERIEDLEPGRDFSFDLNFDILYSIPLGIFHNKDISKGDDSLKMRGIKVDSKELMETEKTNIYYVVGRFERIGLYKKNISFLKRYVTPVFDFQKEVKGALTVIEDKETGKALFLIGANELEKEFNEPEFREIVKSIDFDLSNRHEAPGKGRWQDF